MNERDIAVDEIELRMDEHIVCRNATVIVDGEGKFSGWIDNDKPKIRFFANDGN